MRSSATAVHIHGNVPRPMEGRMTCGERCSPPSGGFGVARGASPGGRPPGPPDKGGPADGTDHAGSVLSRLLMAHPEVVDLEMLGQMDTPEGIIYSLGVMLPDGRELLIDVGYV